MRNLLSNIEEMNRQLQSKIDEVKQKSTGTNERVHKHENEISYIQAKMHEQYLRTETALETNELLIRKTDDKILDLVNEHLTVAVEQPAASQ